MGQYLRLFVFVRQGDLVTSPQGKKMQAQVWGEVVDILKAKVPAVEALAAGNF